MKGRPITPLLLGLLVLPGLPGCPSSDGGNPRVLYLSPNGTDETRVKLVDKEPDPF